MKILNLFFVIFVLIFLSGCVQTTSLLGPGVTIATTGNVFQAGLQFGANSVIKEETGKDVLSHIKDKVDKTNDKKKLWLIEKIFLSCFLVVFFSMGFI